MMMVTDAEYHLAFGLHSGVPLCCAIEFSDGGKGGPCPPCKEKGVVSKEMFSKMHSCHENNPACVPYLELLERRIFNWFVEYRTDKPTNLVEGEQDDFTWGASLYKPMGGYFRDALRKYSYRLVHLCWPEPSVYWYVFQQEGGKKGACGICSSKFSLGFPTAGEQHG
ncbi:hypothetical protein LCGC14_0671080 [marine sediment metagenome]|uniref:Uncharacterized protein n=1 Tax=marine sediment metagenome TaxID=412755 RepID=A0A0F9TYW9_9ZZZZ